MIKITVELTFDDSDITLARLWWKENKFSPDSTLDHVVVSAALNGIGSPDYDILMSEEHTNG